MEEKTCFLQILKCSLLLFVITLMFSCQKEEQKPAGSVSEFINDSEGYFKGVVRLQEKDMFVTYSDIVLTFNGNDVKREVTEKLYKNISYGMIYRKGKDSVNYFYTKRSKILVYSNCEKRLPEWIQELEKQIVDSENMGSTTLSSKPPFGVIFEYLTARMRFLRLKLRLSKIIHQ